MKTLQAKGADRAVELLEPSASRARGSGSRIIRTSIREACASAR